MDLRRGRAVTAVGGGRDQSSLRMCQPRLRERAGLGEQQGGSRRGYGDGGAQFPACSVSHTSMHIM